MIPINNNRDNLINAIKNGYTIIYEDDSRGIDRTANFMDICDNKKIIYLVESKNGE